MERELVLAIVAAALFGIAVWFASLLLYGPHARRPEHLAWWRLTLPLFAGAVVFAFLLGWALQEPDPADEHAGIAMCMLAVVTAGVAIRAVVRSMTALRSSASAHVPICTVGLLEPRPVVSEEFRRSVSEDVLAAALAHEAAHVKRRDPLRIWLAQIAADLQWPIPGTARRFSAWLLALEAERDSEALACGVAGEDLAEAILTAARLQCGRASSLCANATGAGDGIAWRVRRLLSPEATDGIVQPKAFWAVRASCVALVGCAVWLGVNFGDAVLGVLPGVGP